MLVIYSFIFVLNAVGYTNCYIIYIYYSRYIAAGCALIKKHFMGKEILLAIEDISILYFFFENSLFDCNK